MRFRRTFRPECRCGGGSGRRSRWQIRGDGRRGPEPGHPLRRSCPEHMRPGREDDRQDQGRRPGGFRPMPSSRTSTRTVKKSTPSSAKWRLPPENRPRELGRRSSRCRARYAAQRNTADAKRNANASAEMNGHIIRIRKIVGRFLFPLIRSSEAYGPVARAGEKGSC